MTGYRDFAARNGKRYNGSGGTPMPEPVAKPPIRRLIAVPAVITLASRCSASSDVVRASGDPPSERFSISDFVKLFPEFKDRTYYNVIDELRLLANYCKHGAGRSERDLRKRRPEYFHVSVFPPLTLRPLSQTMILRSQLKISRGTVPQSKNG
jgi:hypothetical protein